MTAVSVLIENSSTPRFPYYERVWDGTSDTLQPTETKEGCGSTVKEAQERTLKMHPFFFQAGKGLPGVTWTSVLKQRWDLLRGKICLSGWIPTRSQSSLHPAFHLSKQAFHKHATLTFQISHILNAFNKSCHETHIHTQTNDLNHKLNLRWNTFRVHFIP